MTNKFSQVLAPIWQEVSSLWSGVDFAFFDESAYRGDEETSSNAFQAMTSMDTHFAGDTGHLRQCCC